MDLLCFCSVLCLLCLCARLFICALWSHAGKGLTFWLSFVVSNFPIGILGQVWYLIVSTPDLCTLTYFPYERLAKIYTNLSGHMMMMTTMPIYGKTSLNIFFSGTKRPMALGRGM